MISSDTSTKSLVLALCCAEEELLVVLGDSATPLASESIICPGQSIQHLHPIIKRLLSSQGTGVQDLAGIACVSGPGSFTGLRIAHACMYGLALPFGTPMAGIPYHDILASQTDIDPAQILWVLTYARRRQIYAQRFQNLKACNQISAYMVDALCPLLEADGDIAILGSGVRKNEELRALSNAKILPSSLDTPTPSALLKAARNASFHPTPPAPLYLRKSDAEENLATIATTRGISEAAIRASIYDYK